MCAITCLDTRTFVFARWPAMLGYMAMSRLMFWPRLPCIRQSNFTIYHITLLILSITFLLTLMRFCKMNGTSMSPASSLKYNLPLSDIFIHFLNDSTNREWVRGAQQNCLISQTERLSSVRVFINLLVTDHEIVEFGKKLAGSMLFSAILQYLVSDDFTLLCSTD